MGGVIITVMLVAGLLAGTESTLILTRDDGGSVSAVNVWKIAGTVPLLKRSVRNLREARMQAISLTQKEQRSTAYRNVLGMFDAPEELVLVGDTSLSYPYQEDLSLIRAFLGSSARKREISLVHPLDIRRKVASAALLVLAVLSIGGWIVKLAMGRDPLANMPGKVKALPPAVGQSLFVAAMLAFGWFFVAGHRVFGPVATNKVRHLFACARADDAEGIRKLARSGVFLDVRDDQGTTALLVAVRAGAARAVGALLEAGAQPDASDLSGNTPIGSAVDAHRPEIVKLLIDAGADRGR